MSKKLVFPLALFLIVSTFDGKLLWSDGNEPARISIQGGGLPVSIPVLKPNPIAFNLSVTPLSWEGKAVKLYALANRTSDGSYEMLYWNSQSRDWVTYSDLSEIQPFQAVSSLGAIENLEFVAEASTADSKASRYEMIFCVGLDQEGIDFNPYDSLHASCVRQNVALNSAEVITRGEGSGSLRAASVELSNGMSVGAAQSIESQARPGKASFEVRADGMGPMALVIGADPEVGKYPNFRLQGVKVTVSEVDRRERRGRRESSPVITIENGVVKTSLFSFNADKIIPPASYLRAYDEVRAKTGLRKGASLGELSAYLREPARFFSGLTEEDLRLIEAQEQLYQQNFAQAFSVPVVFRPGAPVGLAVYRPSAKVYRVTVESQAGAAPFAVNAALISNAGYFGGAVSEGRLYSGRNHWNIILEGDRLLQAELNPPAFLAKNEWSSGLSSSRVLFDPPTFDPPPFCKQMVEAKPAKLWATLGVGAINGGILSKIGGAIAGKMGLSAATATSLGEGLGWLSGGLQDISDWVDFEKFSLRFLTVSAFLPVIDKVTLQADRVDLCINPRKPEDQGKDRATIKLQWTNPCDMPLYGFGGSNDIPYRVSDPRVGDLRYQGYVEGLADVWGAGAKYEFHAATVGTTTVEFAMPLLDRVEKYSITFNVKKCASPERRIQ